MAKLLDEININTQPTTTTFVDNSSVIGETLNSVVPETSIPVVEQSIKDFLSKPKLVKQINWTTINNPGDLLGVTPINPFDEIQANSAWLNKIEGYAFVRGTAVFTVTLNATPFQQGRIILHTLPDISDFDTYNCDLSQFTMHNNVELDCRDSVGVLKLPYVAPTVWLNRYTVQSEETQYDWGRFYIHVLSALDSTVASNVDLNVYLHFENFEVSCPVVPQSGGKTYKSIEEMEKSTGMSLSAGLHRASKVATVGNDIPLVSSYSRPLAWALDVASKIASSFGYSKPANDSPAVYTAQNLQYGTHGCDGQFNAARLALRNDNRVRNETSISIREQDEMSFEYLKSIESYFKAVSWSVSDVVNTDLISGGTLTINPFVSNRNVNISRGAATVHTTVEHPVARLARGFRQYRGGIKIRLKFVKTQFHTGRIQIAYTPGNAGSVPDIYATLPMREVVDISAVDSVEMVLPMYYSTDYMTTLQQLGRFNITVVNELRAPSTVPQNINILLYTSFADDFELAVPCSLYFQNSNMLSVSLQSGDSAPLEEIGDQPRQDPSLIYCERSVGERFTSVRQLLKRFTRFYNKIVLDTTRIYIFPHFFSRWFYDPTLPNVRMQSQYGCDSLSFIAPFYAYYRGGVRMAVVPGNTTSSVTLSNVGQSYSTTTYGGTGSNYVAPASVTPFDTTAFTGMNMSVSTTNSHTGIHQMEMPYYSQTRCSLVPLQKGTTYNSLPTTMDCPESILNIGASESTALTNMLFARAAAEDFQLAYFLATPPAYVSYS